VGLGATRGLGVGAGRVGAARLGFAAARAARGWAVRAGEALRSGAWAEARSARAAALCRAAALRALGRWGRVLGRLDSTPGSSAAPAEGDVWPVRRRPPDRFSLLAGLIGVRQSSRIGPRAYGTGACRR
jgi:hypothetical protein